MMMAGANVSAAVTDIAGAVPGMRAVYLGGSSTNCCSGLCGAYRSIVSALVFAALNPRQFEACFICWMRHVYPALTDQVVAIDGKTVRGSHQAGQRAIHLVSAYGTGLGVVLGQVRTAEKSNEITAIPELLDALLLKGAIVTIDAMGCRSAIARRIVAAEADYVLAVKDNQRSLLAHLQHSLDGFARNLQAFRDHHYMSEHREVEKDHRRLETRRCIATDILTRWEDPGLWPGMCSIAMVEATRDTGGAVTKERRVEPAARRGTHRTRGALALAH